jgi:hypothetical protein
MQVILVASVLGNLLFSLFVFVLIGKPMLLHGVIARFVGLHAEWQFGSLSMEELERLNQIGKRLGYLGLAALFVWSCLSGVLLQLMVM